MNMVAQLDEIPELAPQEQWFSVTEVSPTVVRITEPHVNVFMQSNIWLLRSGENGLLIDTGNGIAPLKAALNDLLPRDLITVATHAHADHVGSLHEFDRVLAHTSIVDALRTADPDATLAESDYALHSMAGLKVGPPRLSMPLARARPYGFDPAKFGPKPVQVSAGLRDGDTIDQGQFRFNVLHVPGHSPACIALYEPRQKLLIAGDAIYDGPLVDDLHHSDKMVYRTSLERLLDLEVALVIAGHGEPFSGEHLKKLIADYLSGF